MANSSSVLIFSAYFAPAYRAGGPIRTLEALSVRASSKYRLAVLTSNADLGVSEPLDVRPDSWVRRDGVQIYYSTSSWRAYWRALRQARELRTDVVYLNSFFGVKYSIIPSLLWKLGWFRDADLLVAPRGEFGRGALAIKPVRKRVWIALSKLLRLHRRAYWHASTTAEAEDMAMAAAVLPNRILVREDETDLRASQSERRVDPKSLKAVVIARLAPVKGIDILLRALGSVEGDITIDVIGLEEDPSYAVVCRELAREVAAGVHVRFLGALEHDQVLERLGDYDVMLHPTRGENFGHAVPEALSRGVPVFCSAHTPWTALLRAEGGGVVDPNSSDGWAALVRSLRMMTEVEWRALRDGAVSAYQTWTAETSAISVFDMLQEVQEKR